MEKREVRVDLELCWYARRNESFNKKTTSSSHARGGGRGGVMTTYVVKIGLQRYN